MAKIGYKKNVVELQFTGYINKDQFDYAILEKANELIFDKFDNININDLTNCIKGRLFGGKTELKWQKRRSGFHLVIITEESSLPEFFDNYPCELKPIKTRSIYLWGIIDPVIKDHWYEKQIPRILKYPVIRQNLENSENRVKINVQEYELSRNSKNDEPASIIHRFVDIMEV